MVMKRPMVAFLTQLLLVLRSWFTRRVRLEAENLILRQQLVGLQHRNQRLADRTDHRLPLVAPPGRHRPQFRVLKEASLNCATALAIQPVDACRFIAAGLSRVLQIFDEPILSDEIFSRDRPKRYDLVAVNLPDYDRV